MRNTISLFMWGYQQHFRKRIQRLARSVLYELGVEEEALVLLVGVRRPDSSDRNPVCVEPEDGKWLLSYFEAISDSVEEIYSKHPLQRMHYGDEQSNLEKPERMRKSSVVAAVKEALAPFDKEYGVQSFLGAAQLVGEFYVVPAIQISQTLFDKFPPLISNRREDESSSASMRGLIQSALEKVLEEAGKELQHSTPGRGLVDAMRRPEEIVRIAAEDFMRFIAVALADRYEYSELFSGINLISSLLYEGAKGAGKLILSKPNNPRLEYLMKFRDPVSFREPRWARKLLQMVSPTTALIADSLQVYGLGRLNDGDNKNDQSAFTVDFVDHYSWKLSCGEIDLLQSSYGVPRLPNEIFGRSLFVDNLARIFPESTKEDHDRIWSLFNAAASQDFGSMIVVSNDAENEAKRLELQGTVIQPTALSVDLLRQVSSIDGTVLLDHHGICHAIGVILDGVVNDECTPSRGSRFNSAVRYLHSDTARRFAIVVSDDRTVDLLPGLRARASKKRILERVEEFSKATVDNYHSSMNWLSAHRFYLDAEQCAQINSSLKRLDDEPREVGEIRYLVASFEADSRFDESYLST